MKMMDGSSRSPNPVHGADASPWDDTSIVKDAMDLHAMDAEDAAIDFLPFTFGQALHTLSGLPLPPDFQMPDEHLRHDCERYDEDVHDGE